MRTDIKYIAVMLCVAVLAISAAGCKKVEIDTYADKSKLWFANVNDEGMPINDLVRSFSHFPGKDKLVVPFPVKLIGPIADRDREFKAVVVDTLTTAVAAEYELSPMKLRAGNITDTLWVTLVKSPRMETSEVMLTLYIVDNEDFAPGYSNRLSAKVRFNNITTQPDWWNEEMELSYFGVYSKKKFETFCVFSGRYEVADLAPSQLRRLLLDFKAYIAKNKITEEDGSPMIIPIQ